MRGEAWDDATIDGFNEASAMGMSLRRKVSPIPEPSAALCFAVGFTVMAAAKRLRR